MVRPAPESWSRALRGSPGVLPGAIVLVVLLYWAARDGGFDPLRWLPGALFFLALLVVAAVAAKRVTLPRSAAVAVAALAGFTIWSFLSITWAGVPADAWRGADKTLLYLSVFGLFVMFPWRAGVAAATAGGFSVGVAALGVATVVRASVSDDPSAWFIGGKLTAPIVYANANTALYMMAFFPALYLSMRREVHPLLRGVLLATAGVLPQLALMIQSRASLAAIPVVLVAFLLVVPGRTRSLVALLLTGTAALATSRSMLDVYGPALTGQGLRGVLVDARSSLFLSAAVLMVVGVAIGVSDRRFRVHPTLGRATRIVAASGVAVVLIAASTTFVVREGAPWSRAGDWAQAFREEQNPVSQPGTPYLASGLGGGRYDLWSVAWTLFREHPVRGVGVDNFAVDYVRLRRQVNDSAFPHSIELRLLSQTGLVGTTLFVIFLAAAAAAVAPALRRGPALARGVAGATSAVFFYWLVHGSAEWFWEMPALAATAFAFLGIAMRLGPTPVPAATPARRLPRPLLVAGTTAVAVVASVSLVLPWLAALDIKAAVRGWSGDPGAAFDRLGQARSLNPLTDEADVFAGVIAGQLGDTARQRAAFQRALERNPANWYPYLELGVLDVRRGRNEAGLRRVEQARRLNPLEPVLIVVEGWLEEGRTPTRDDLDQLLLSRADHLRGGVR